MANPFFTIGHSTRSIDEFIGLLREAEVQAVVDVRTIPRSRRNPQFNKDALPETLQAFQIGYEHMIELGGRRGKQHLAEPSPNGAAAQASPHSSSFRTPRFSPAVPDASCDEVSSRSTSASSAM